MSRVRKTVQSCCLGLTLSIPLASQGYQADGPFLEAQKKHATQWQQEDRQIDENLAALEKRFGKKPNIIYILTDDVGWGERGWQYGVRWRGTPTPELDQLAAQPVGWVE